MHGVGDPVVIVGAGRRRRPACSRPASARRALAALDCPRPRRETWFTGVGGGAEHTSVIELVNPDDGPAVADITVLGRAGPLDAADLRGRQRARATTASGSTSPRCCRGAASSPLHVAVVPRPAGHERAGP